MPPQLTPAEQLTHSTVRIECETTEGIATGTGFFYKALDDGTRSVPVIVTNKHVVQDASLGWFHLTLRAGDGGPKIGNHLRIEMPDFKSRWIPHPDDDVDLCVMPVRPLLEEAGQLGHEFFFIELNKNLIPSATDLGQLSALEDVIMIGYPNGIWDAVNNQPVVRRGVTATHPNVDYEGRREFMIDAACFPGSSGSPVFLFNPGSWVDRRGTTIMDGGRIKLLGALYAGPQHTVTGEIQIVDVPTRRTPVRHLADSEQPRLDHKIPPPAGVRFRDPETHRMTTLQAWCGVLSNDSLEQTGRPAPLPRPELRPGRPAAQLRR